MYIDSHSHIAWQNGELQVTDLLADMDKNQIEKRVISCINNEDLLETNRRINDLCEQYPDRLIGCAVINPKCKNALAQVEAAIQLSHIRFLEFDSFEHGYYPDLQENLAELFAVIANSDLLVKVFVGIGARAIPQQWEKYIKTFPNLTFIFLHMGCFDYGYTCIDVAKRNPNVLVETSNQYELQILRKALHELGAAKIIFGTKYPERLTSSSIHLFDMLHIDDTTKQQIYYDNVQKLLG